MSEPETDGAAQRSRITELVQELEKARRDLSLFRAVLLQMPAIVAVTQGSDQVLRLVNQPWLDAVGRREAVGMRLREVLPELESQGLHALADRVLLTGEPFVGRGVPVDLDRAGTGALERRYFTFHYLPIVLESGERTGIQVHAVDVTAQVIAEHQALALGSELRTFLSLAENAPVGIISARHGVITYANPMIREMTGQSEALVGAPIAELVTRDSREALAALQERRQREGSAEATLWIQRQDGSSFPGHIASFLIRGPEGEVSAEAAIVRDLTEERRREEEQQRFQEQIIEAQRQAIRELSTPLIPLAAGLVVMPLIGSLDGARADQVTETLLHGVVAHQARTAILDVTGLKGVDAGVAAALLRTAQAARLLGTEVVLTGITPEVARVLVEIGADLGGVLTYGTLQTGVAQALKRYAR
jgi:PAS domain S-box-containing protein